MNNINSTSNSGPTGHIASITVLYFAAAQTETQLFSEEIPLSVIAPLSSDLMSSLAPRSPHLSDLAATLVARYPHTKLASVLESSAWSLNEEMVPDDADGESMGAPNEMNVRNVVLKAGDVVAVIPPVSGG